MNGTEIKSIKAHQVYTNRGNVGIEAIVTTENGAVGEKALLLLLPLARRGRERMAPSGKF